MVVDVIRDAVAISGFVLIMMLLIEYINVQTRGKWQNSLKKNRFSQYFLAAFLGIIPGCLGAFTVVSLYSHRMLGFGALVAAMIATSGDEAFVMLAMFPVDTIKLSIILFFTAIIVGYICDFIFKEQKYFLKANMHELELHNEDQCRCFSKQDFLPQLKNISFYRALLLLLLGFFLVVILFADTGPQVWDWKKIIFVLGTVSTLLIVITVPDHFLQEHFYGHVIKKHLIRIFLWTFSTLFLIQFAQNNFNIANWLKEMEVAVLLIAVLTGIIPESGPHLFFVTMYADGLIPFAILLASSISQDGHGTLPLLAVSIKAFIWLKIVNVVVGLMLGSIYLAL